MEGQPEYDPDQAWRDVETCDVEAYESWLEWRASQHDPVPARVRIEHAKFLSGKGTPEKQRAFVSELIQLQFKRFHDPGHSNGSTGGAISRRKTATDYDREAADRLASLPGKDPGPM
jgi:hypothetical protein